MERKRIYKLKWIRAKRKLHDLLEQMLRLNKRLKHSNTRDSEPGEPLLQDEIRHLNTMLRQQNALVRFYEEKVKK